ncbi:MAG: hypothetical protein IKJ92_03240 [Bacteroidaceae bacterium]|jgi:hypothetical protein|nr:hypothetical protein [Bacteroidaceae bacterium]
MIDVVFSIPYLYNHCRMISLSRFEMMLYDNIPHFRLIGLYKVPPRRILHEILTVRTSMILVVESTYRIDTRLELLAREGHVDTAWQRGIAGKQEIHVWSISFLCPL